MTARWVSVRKKKWEGKEEEERGEGEDKYIERGKGREKRRRKERKGEERKGRGVLLDSSRTVVHSVGNTYAGVRAWPIQGKERKGKVRRFGRVNGLDTKCHDTRSQESSFESNEYAIQHVESRSIVPRYN